MGSFADILTSQKGITHLSAFTSTDNIDSKISHTPFLSPSTCMYTGASPPHTSIVDMKKLIHKPTSVNPYPTPTSPCSISSHPSSTSSSTSPTPRRPKKRPRPKRKAGRRPLSKIYSYPSLHNHLLELTVVVPVTFVGITSPRRLDLSFPNGLGNKNYSLMTYVSCLVTLVTAGAQPLTRPQVLIVATPNITRRGIR